MTRIAIDSNILAYLAGVSRTPDDDRKIGRTRELIARLSIHVSLIAPAQALGELFVLLRRAGTSAGEARTILMEFADSLGGAESTSRSVVAAADLVVDHKLQFWDALIVGAAAEAGCTMLLSEDMQKGFVVRGLTILDPLAEPLHPKLAALLATPA